MVDKSTAVDALAADEYTRQRLAAALTPDDVPLRIGEAFVLQAASIGLTSAQGTRGDCLSVGVALEPPYVGAHVLLHLPEVFAESVALLGCEATDIETMVSLTADTTPVIDSSVALVVFDAVQHASDTLQTALTRAVSAGSVPTLSDDGTITYEAARPITVAGEYTPQDGRAIDELFPATPHLTRSLDIVVDTVSAFADPWEPAVETPLEPVDVTVIIAYFKRMASILPDWTSDATANLEAFRDALQISTTTEGTRPYGVTTTAVIATVETLATIVARLTLEDSVRSAHVTEAIELYRGSLEPRSIEIEATTYWHEFHDAFRRAFDSDASMYTHLIRTALDRHNGQVTISDVVAVADEYGVELADPEAELAQPLAVKTLYTDFSGPEPVYKEY